MQAAFRVALLLATLVGPLDAWLPMARNPLVAAGHRARIVTRAEEATATAEAAEETAEKPKRNVGGTVLVSGFMDEPSRTDQFVFDMLHKHEAFEKIAVYSADNSFAKKRLTSRSARYTGLLDVLDFVQGSLDDLLKGADGPLAGVNSWLGFAVDSATLVKQAEAAKSAGVKNLVLLCATDAEFAAAAGVLEGSKTEYTFIRTGEIVDGPDDRNVIDVGEVTDSLPAGANITRNDAIRVASESLVLPLASKKSFTLFRGGDEAAEYLKLLRESGFDRQKEIAAVIGGGKAEWLENKDKVEDDTMELTEEELEQQRLEEERWQKAQLARAQEEKEEQEREVARRIEIEFQLRFFEKRDLYGDADGCQFLEDYREKFFDSFAEDCKRRMYRNEAGELRVEDDDWEEERTRHLENSGVDEREKMYAAQIDKQLDKMKEMDYVEE